MRYLLIARGLNEPDNNTPSDEILCRVVECDSEHIAGVAKLCVAELENSGAYDHGVEADYRPLDEFNQGWAKVTEIW